MSPISLWFFTFVLLFSCAFQLCNTAKSRHYLLVLSNGLILSSFAVEIYTLAVVFLFSILGFLVIKLAKVNKDILPNWVVIVSVVCVFIYFKRYVVIPEEYLISAVYSFIGLSYILFRIIHIFVDIRGGAIAKDINFIEFVAYLLFFPNFTSGPIQRYQDFSRQCESPQEIDRQATQQGIGRIATGYIKAVLIAPLLYSEFEYVRSLISVPGKGYLLNQIPGPIQSIFINSDGDSILRHLIGYEICIPIYFLYLFVNFSGYMDIVVGSGRLMGFKIPENFNKPLKSANFLDFWSRWHITLSEWFKFYFFNPLLKYLIVKFPARYMAPWLAVFCYFVTFLVLGLWHGSTGTFFIYGLLLGFGVSINKLYQLLFQKILGRTFYRSVCGNWYYATVCRGFALSFFSVSIICLWHDVLQLRQLWEFFELKGIILSMVMLTPAMILMLLLFDGFDSAGKSLETFIAKSKMQSGAALTWAAIKLLIVIYAVVDQITFVPKFVYEGF